MKKFVSIVAIPGLWTFAAAAEPADTTQSSGVDEIVVTARRMEESLMDVPQTVSAVSGAQLQEFNILKFEDLSQLVPGLDLNSDNSGFRATASVRGVAFDVSSQGTPTVETYFNEVAVEPSLVFQGNFDIGQIEVLRGPQGTLRGRSAPSGSIIEHTRRPDLLEVGSYASTNVSDLGGINVQGALGMPIVDEKLAIRVAALYDYNDAGGVEGAFNGKDPHAKTVGARGSLRFEPTDTITANFMYQHMERTIDSYGQISFGPGTAGNVSPATPAAPPFFPAGLPAVNAPANFNGPPLTGDERKSIVEFPRHVVQDMDIITLQADWVFAKQKLSYVGGYSGIALDAAGDSDLNNTIIGKIGPVEDITSWSDRKTHELRLSSDERLFGFMDYTLGGYYGRYFAHTILDRPDTLINQGAFGSPLGIGPAGGPGTLSPYAYDSRYAHDLKSDSRSINEEKSVFANLMFHIGDKVEISAGGRKIFQEYTKSVDARSIAGIQAMPNPNGLGACPATINVSGAPAPVVGSTYPGTCDVRPNAPTLLRSVPETTREDDPFVYSSSIAVHWTPEVMTYASYGTSWRAGPGPITGAPLCAAVSTPGAPNPTLCDQYNILDSEEAEGIELGLKWALLDRRLGISVAAYAQEYDGFLTFGLPTPYLTGVCNPANVASASPACRVTTGGFTYNADVKTKGVDLDLNFALSEDLTVGAAYSYAKGRFQDTPVPCRDQLGANGAPGFDGVPDSGALLTTAQWVALGGPYGPTLCASDSSSATSPPWNANLRGEYSHEIFQGGRAFVRTLFNFYPKNTNRSVANAGFIPDSYELLSLYLGVRSDDGAWEISVAGTNILDDDNVLTETLNDGTLLAPQGGRTFGASSGYRTMTLAPRREFSLSMRYAFGSR